MKQRVHSLIKADVITLALAAPLAVAVVWLVINQFAGVENPLEDRLFSFALGINLGNTLRLVVGRSGQGR